MRAAVGIARCAIGKGAKGVDLRQRFGVLLNLARKSGGILPQFLENFDLQRFRLVIGTENPGFHFLEFRRNKPFTIYESLFADIIRRNAFQIGFRHLDIKSEYAVVMHFQ